MDEYKNFALTDDLLLPLNIGNYVNINNHFNLQTYWRYMNKLNKNFVNLSKIMLGFST